MSLVEIKKTVLALTPRKRRELATWLVQMDAGAEEDMVLATASAWRELDREEQQNEKRKVRRGLDR